MKILGQLITSGALLLALVSCSSPGSALRPTSIGGEMEPFTISHGTVELVATLEDPEVKEFGYVLVAIEEDSRVTISHPAMSTLASAYPGNQFFQLNGRPVAVWLVEVDQVRKSAKLVIADTKYTRGKE
jgi:hypothetical protein